ncbi:MAG: IS1595 family transposase [Lentisphaeraceae bacterium]|nr:IS1595 family transposase [Lentisphaeraceae bacterium]
MGINKIQFQIGLSLVEFLECFETEEDCRTYLRQTKWPNGFCCRRCSCNKSSKQLQGIREIHECLNCFYKESLLAHTLFEHSHLPLKSWFLAIQLLTQAKTCMSAMELQRHLKVNIKTANLVKHKIMQTLTGAEEKRFLQRRIECHDAYLGGVLKNAKQDCGSENKAPFVAALETSKDLHPKDVVLSSVASFTRSEIKKWAENHVAHHAYILTDGLGYFRSLGTDCCHLSYNMKLVEKLVADHNFKWIKTVQGNVKTAFSGALHSFDFFKYSMRYLEKFRFCHPFDLRQCLYKVLRPGSSTDTLFP